MSAMKKTSTTAEKKNSLEQYLYNHLISTYPGRATTSSLVKRSQDKFEAANKGRVVACLVALCESNLVVSSVNSNNDGWTWKAVKYRSFNDKQTPSTPHPRSQQQQEARENTKKKKKKKDDRHQVVSRHSITRHTSMREIEEEVHAYFIEGPSYAYTTGDVVNHCSDTFGDSCNYLSVKNALKNLAEREIIASFRTENVRGYRWYLAEGISPSCDKLRPYITSILEANGHADSRFIVNSIRWDMNRRVRYRAVTETLKKLAEEGILISERLEGDRCYRWFLVK